MFLGKFTPYCGADAALWDKRRAALQSRNRMFDNTLPWEFHPHLWELPPVRGTLHADFYLHSTRVMRQRKPEELYRYIYSSVCCMCVVCCGGGGGGGAKTV